MWYDRPMADTIFKKIIEGKIPCHRIYEDERVLAFLDINPVSPGHTLLVPKEEAETLDQLSEESASAIGRVLPRLCRAVIRATGTREYNVLQNNGPSAHQSVGQVHFHVIPKPDSVRGLGVHWPTRPLEAASANELCERIRANMK
jgi:histidine triad (HIT) family protein